MMSFRRFDGLGFATMLVLIAVGTVAVWSAGTARTEVFFHTMWIRNLTTAAVGLVLYLALALFDYRKWIGLLSVPAYVLSLVFLVAVLFVGSGRGPGASASSLRARWSLCQSG